MARYVFASYCLTSTTENNLKIGMYIQRNLVVHVEQI